MRGLPYLPALAIVLVAGACADDSVGEDPPIEVTTGVGGASSGTTSSSSSGQATSSSTGTGGEGPVGLGPPYPIVLAHGFFGFEEFAGLDFATYFFEVKEHLAENGEPLVFTPAVDPFNDSSYRGAQLYEHVEAILAETGHEKVILIGHSQGGLDARVVAHDHPERIAAVITFATPHRGTPVADVVLELVSDPNLQSLVDDLVNLVGAPLYDAVGDETAVTKPMHLFSQPGIAAFNAAYPDATGVFYASVTGRTDRHLGGQACAPDESVPFVSKYATVTDPTDPLLWVSEAICDGNGSIANDGLVRAADAKRGVFWGCVPADHLDQVGHLLGDNPGLGNGFDHRDFFRGLVEHLRSEGY
jgi:triacylglycerol lipase